MDWLERCSHRLPCRWPRIAAASGRALLAERAGDRDEAEAQFERALALHQGVDLRLEEVETLLAYGSFLRRAGPAARARSVLGSALALAHEIEASWLARHVRAELVLAGGHGRRRRPPDELTPSEERIARLVVDGRSNTELARLLSVSVNTVETHLVHIYAKVGGPLPLRARRPPQERRRPARLTPRSGATAARRGGGEAPPTTPA